MNQALVVLSAVSARHVLILDILCVTYFLTSITMPDTQTNDMHQIQ